MQFERLLLPLLIVWPSVALADLQQTIRDYKIEIAALEAAHDEWLDRGPAQTALRQAFSENGIGFSMMYVESWGDSFYLNWSAVRRIYTNAEYRLSDWSYTVGSGRFDEAAVEGMLAEGMQVLRHIDAQVDPWFRDDLKNSTERAYWLDRANEAGCCDEPYYYYSDVADRAYADSISPPYWTVGRIQVFAPVPEEGGTLTDPRSQNFARLALQVEAAVQSGDRDAIRGAVGGTAAMFSYYPSQDTAELRDVLTLLHERMGFEDASIAELLRQAEAIEDRAARDAALRTTQYALSERLGHLAPLLAAGAVADGDAAKASVLTRLAAEAKRLVMLRDDLENPFSTSASGLLRAVSGFNAAAGLLDMANTGDVTTSQAMAVINDFGGSLKVSPTAPFAAPAGAVAAQLGETRAAFDHASEAMTAVGDAIGGDPAALDRALRAAAALEETLDPRNFVRKMKTGFIDGLVSNMPIARSIFEWFKA